MAIKITTRARRIFGVTLGIATLSLGFITAGGAANASTLTPTPTTGQSCSLDLGSGSLTCVNAGQDLNQAVLAQQHLRVVVPTGARGVTASVSVTPLAGVLTTFVQSQLYDDVNYGGSFFQITNSSACNGSTVYYLSNLGSYGWSGRVSSFKSFSYCSTKVWQGNNETGSAYGYNVKAASLGAMNDRANSASMK